MVYSGEEMNTLLIKTPDLGPGLKTVFALKIN